MHILAHLMMIFFQCKYHALTNSLPYDPTTTNTNPLEHYCFRNQPFTSTFNGIYLNFPLHFKSFLRTRMLLLNSFLVQE